jgi:hypothetical protein
VHYLAQTQDPGLYWCSFMESDVAGKLELTLWGRGDNSGRGCKNGRGNVVGGKNEQIPTLTCHVKLISHEKNSINKFIME